MITVEEILGLTGQEFPQAMVDAWVLNIEALAEDCLEPLSPAKKKAALLNLIAHFLTLQGADGMGRMASETLGDASMTFFTSHTGSGSAATSFGALAKRIAPCLGPLMGDEEKLYGGITLIR